MSCHFILNGDIILGPDSGADTLKEGIEHIVAEGTARQRISDYLIGKLAELPSKNAVKKAIKAGRIQVEGNAADTALWIVPGMKITLLAAEKPKAKVYEIQLEVLFEDDYLAVVIKPGGLTVSGNQFKTLQNALPFNLKASQVPGALALPRPVHRLDHPTSGIVIVAKTAASAADLGQQFAERSIQKTYQAVVAGFTVAEFLIEAELDGKTAITRGRCIRTVNGKSHARISLLELFPETGRTHQLRRHLADTGNPIIGDREYGPEGQGLLNKGLLLAATGLRFVHPENRGTMEFENPAPAKFEKLMDREERRSTENP